MIRVLFFAIVFSFSGAAAALNTVDMCVKFPWACYGVLEVQGEGQNIQKPRLRAIRYLDGDTAFEIEEKGVVSKRLHIFRANRAEFFFGVEPSAIISPRTNPAANPFAFVDMVLGIPVMVLQKAFPGGLATVPDGISQKIVNVAVEHKDDSFTLKTERLTSKQLRYWIKSNNSNNPELFGLWDGDIQVPLSDDFPLSDWVHDGDAKVKDAGEARSLNSVKN
ncbi:hypothetical protein NP590_13200 [Methylomonas sp. SURF-2]|uniref:DUF2330 domain-containing protein n=1 Tax=Methylomonas subterranea TaxID=2952225 RepID=A0ABT1THY5_9GAMM|nr:hypothetical protein [Methylomonas sp. SURF-2]MCQ8105067.1 hypothetical protein [Methylomonas sp. SURF-2]